MSFKEILAAEVTAAHMTCHTLPLAQESITTLPVIEKVCHATIDIGSGSTKLCVATVNKKTGQICELLFAKETPILVAHNLKERGDGNLGDEILLKVENQIREYYQTALTLGATKMSGVATAAFRESINGRNFIDEISKSLKINLQVITQQEEGNIGFLTAVAVSGKNSNDVISWDSGGASFQISYHDGEKVSVYEGPWGKSKVLAEIVKIQGHPFTSESTANPATINDVLQLCEKIKEALPSLSSGLQGKIQELEGKVIATGGGRSIFDMAKIALGKECFNKDEVWLAIESLVGKTDEELAHFPESTMVLPKLALLYSVMEYFGIKSVHKHHATGSTLGIFMNKSYWVDEAL